MCLQFIVENPKVFDLLTILKYVPGVKIENDHRFQLHLSGVWEKFKQERPEANEKEFIDLYTSVFLSMVIAPTSKGEVSKSKQNNEYSGELNKLQKPFKKIESAQKEIVAFIENSSAPFLTSSLSQYLMCYEDLKTQFRIHLTNKRNFFKEAKKSYFLLSKDYSPKFLNAYIKESHDWLKKNDLLDEGFSIQKFLDKLRKVPAKTPTRNDIRSAPLIRR